MIPYLKLDSSGSAKVKFSGSPVSVGIHPVRANIPQLQLVCPGKTCKACSKMWQVPLYLNCLWDYRTKRWTLFLLHFAILNSIKEQCLAAGILGATLKDGTGPDVILQRGENRIETIVCPETVGRKPPVEAPMIDEKILSKIAQKSVWTMYDSISEVEKAFPKIF